MILTSLKVAGLVTLALFLWPVLIVISFGNEIIRIFISIRLLFTRYSLLRDGADNFWWNSLLSGKMVVVGLFSSGDCAIQLEYELEKFKRAMQRQEVDGSCTYAKLMKPLLLKFGYGCSLNTEFRLEDHVKFYFQGEKKEVDKEISEDDFLKIILPTLAKNMDSSKPQWEWLIFPKIRKINGDLNSLRIFRFDHSYMDGCSAALFMAENLFDQQHPPLEFTINPRQPRQGMKMYTFLSKFLAFFVLPLVILVGIGSRFFRATIEKQPFAVLTLQKERKLVFAGPLKLNLNMVKMAAESTKCDVLSILLNSYGPSLHGVLSKLDQERLSEESIEVGLPIAILPYTGGKPTNQFTTTTMAVLLSRRHFELTRFIGPAWTYYCSKAFFDWMGRFPISILESCIPLNGAAVSLNNVPFLKRAGTINGSLVEEVVGWSVLCQPEGLSVIVTSYGDNLSLTALSVEECMSQKELDDFLRKFANDLTALVGSC